MTKLLGKTSTHHPKQFCKKFSGCLFSVVHIMIAYISTKSNVEIFDLFQNLQSYEHQT